MDFFQEIKDMNFTEAYNEMASTLYADSKEFLKEKAAELQERENISPAQVIEAVGERMFG